MLGRHAVPRRPNSTRGSNLRAVSYTHLDVYKRQDGSWDSAKARFVTGDFNGDSLSDVVGVYEYPGYNPSITVSYTHLDVYKRQPWDRPGQVR